MRYTTMSARESILVDGRDPGKLPVSTRLGHWPFIDSNLSYSDNGASKLNMVTCIFQEPDSSGL